MFFGAFLFAIPLKNFYQLETFKHSEIQAPLVSGPKVNKNMKIELNKMYTFKTEKNASREINIYNEILTTIVSVTFFKVHA